MSSVITHGRFIDSLACVYYANDPAAYNQKVLVTFGEITKFKNSSIELFGYFFKLETRKGRGYPIVLKAEEGIEIRATITHPSSNPCIELKLCRPLIWSGNPLETMKLISEGISEVFGAGDLVVQRVDLCIHASGYNLSHDDRKNFTGKFREKTTYYATSSKRNDELTGFRFGTPNGKTIFFKIYNKTLELSERKSCDPSPFYTTPKNENIVWCIEATFERSRLKDYEINSLSDLQLNLANLWYAATNTFVQLKDADANDTKMSRREPSAFWHLVQSSWGESDFILEIPKDKYKVKQLVISRNRVRLKQILIGLGKNLGLATKEKLFVEISKTITDKELEIKSE